MPSSSCFLGLCCAASSCDFSSFELPLHCFPTAFSLPCSPNYFSLPQTSLRWWGREAQQSLLLEADPRGCMVVRLPSSSSITSLKFHTSFIQIAILVSVSDVLALSVERPSCSLSPVWYSIVVRRKMCDDTPHHLYPSFPRSDVAS